MISENEYKQKVAEKWNGEVEVIGKYKGAKYPILVKDKYGVMQCKAYSVLNYRPSIKQL